MSRLLSAFVCALAISLTSACASEPTSPDPSFPVSLTLGFGQTASAGGLSLTFADINDQRCPMNALCISAGEAYIQLNMSANGRAVSRQLQLYDTAYRVGAFEGYTIEVKDLVPYRDTSRLMSNNEYKVTLDVRR